MRAITDDRKEHNAVNGGRRRVLLVGLDGATFDIILPLVESGRLPVLASLMQSGAWGDLLSTRPPLSPVAWTSFLTGKNPGRHGVFGFEEIIAGTYEFRPVAARRAGHASLWRMIGDQGRRVVALDIPFSYPPEAVNGCLIAGYGTPVGEGIEFTWPQRLRAELESRFGECKVAVPRMKAAPPRRALFRKWDHILDNRRRIAGHLIRTTDWDVFMIVLGVTDHLQHGAWTYFDPVHPDSQKPEAEQFREALFDYYRKADFFIGELLEAAGGSLHVVVLSDHGFGTTWSGRLTRRILADAGWLRYRGGSGGRRVVDWLRRAYDAAPRLKRFLHRRPGDRARLKRAVASTIDWQGTVAFPASMGWQVYVNRKGDFPAGRIEAGESYEALCGQIKKRLESFEPSGMGRRVIRCAWRREEIYSGEATERAPDFFVEYENLYGAKTRGGPGDWDLVGSHAMNGILIASGPDVRPGRLTGARIIDVAPTVLYLLGLRVPEDLDGCVLSDVLRPEVLRDRPVRHAGAEASPGRRGPEEQTLSAQEEALVREQLRDLGYID